MKKLLVLMLLIVITACSKEDIQPNSEPVVDCECDRVVDVNSFNLPDGTKFGYYVTVNDCTNFQQNHEFTGASNQPSIGDCK